MDFQPATIAFQPNKKDPKFRKLILGSQPKENDMFHVQRRQSRKSISPAVSTSAEFVTTDVGTPDEPKSCPTLSLKNSFNKRRSSKLENVQNIISIQIDGNTHVLDLSTALRAYMLVRSPSVDRHTTVVSSSTLPNSPSFSIVTHQIIEKDLILLVNTGVSTVNFPEFTEATWIIIPKIRNIIEQIGSTTNPSLMQLDGLYALPRKCAVKTFGTLEANYAINATNLIYFDSTFTHLVLMKFDTSSIWMYNLSEQIEGLNCKGSYPFSRFLELSYGNLRKIKTTLWFKKGKAVFRRDWVLNYDASRQPNKPTLNPEVIAESAPDQNIHPETTIHCKSETHPSSVWSVADLTQHGQKLYYVLAQQTEYCVVCVDSDKCYYSQSQSFSGKINHLKLMQGKTLPLLRVDKQYAIVNCD